jgi:hypothetical protein
MLLRLVRLAVFPGVASTTLCFGFGDPSACSGRRCTTCPVEQVKGIFAERRQTSTDEAFEAFRLYARARQPA